MANLKDYIQNDLLAITAGKMLDARQGKVLYDLIQDAKLNGINYIMVIGGKTPTENAAELQAAFNAAKQLDSYIGEYTVGYGNIIELAFNAGDVIKMYDENMDQYFYYEASVNIADCQEEPYDGSAEWTFLPNGYTPVYALSATNRVTIVIAPGKYTFAQPFVVDNAYIDIVSLTGNPDVILNGIDVTSNGNFIKGIECVTSRFKIASGLNLLVVENCIALVKYSFQVSGSNTLNLGNSVSGTFIDCIGGDASFGGYEIASGTFIRCETLNGGTGFAYSGTASGVFKECSTSGRGFAAGAAAGVASGTFIRCRVGAQWSFGGLTASGTFEECVSTAIQGFAGNGNGTASGIFKNCSCGDYGFGGQGGYFTGKAINCHAGQASFGESGLTGKLVGCSTTTTFTAPTSGGKIVNCTDGTFNPINV